MEVFKEECPTEASDNIVLVGTKADDVENRKIPHETALRVSQQFGCIAYFECSASTGENVDEAFFSVASRAFQKTQMMVKSAEE